jgi:hypothetical protein
VAHTYREACRYDTAEKILKWEDNIEMELKETRSEGVQWIHVGQNKGPMVRSCEHDNSIKGGGISKSTSATISFSRRTLLHMKTLASFKPRESRGEIRKAENVMSRFWKLSPGKSIPKFRKAKGNSCFLNLLHTPSAPSGPLVTPRLSHPKPLSTPRLRLSVVRAGRPLPPERFLVLISVRG